MLDLELVVFHTHILSPSLPVPQVSESRGTGPQGLEEAVTASVTHIPSL